LGPGEGRDLEHFEGYPVLSRALDVFFPLWYRLLKKVFKEADFAGRTALILATWFGSGLAPVAPGTFGTLAGVPLVLLMGRLGTLQALLFVLFFIAVALWSAEVTRKMLAGNDPSVVVVDEVAGFLLTLFLIPLSIAHVCLGFFLFRVFDILKPFPIRNLEKLKGGFGIVADDLLAGVYANLSLKLLLFFL
jgi:phosphatidylglycerophosphatase A